MRPRRHAGSDYITIFLELAETPRVLYATVGRGIDIVGEFVGHLFEATRSTLLGCAPI